MQKIFPENPKVLSTFHHVIIGVLSAEFCYLTLSFLKIPVLDNGDSGRLGMEL